MRPDAPEDTRPPDQHPAFWAEYHPPASRVAAAIQMPLSDPNWQSRVLNAYLQDARARRKEEKPDG
jgi:hypothetical protein